MRSRRPSHALAALRAARHDGRMRIEIVEGDITTHDVDVIVNAANSTLLGGGGVDGAIHAAAGPRLLDACRAIREERYPQGLPVGESVVTPGFDLAARWVIHTVGPNWHAGERAVALLGSCFFTSLELAVEIDASSIAYPAISAGAYGWDVHEVAHVARRALHGWELATAQDDGDDGQPRAHGIDLVRFVLFSPVARAAFEQEFVV